MSGQHKYPTEVLRAYLNSLLFLEPKVLLPCLYSKNLITLAEKDIISGVSNSSVEQMDKLLSLLLKNLDRMQKSNDTKGYLHLFASLLRIIAKDMLHTQLAERMLQFQQTGSADGIKDVAQTRAALGNFDLSSLNFFASSDETDTADAEVLDFLTGDHQLPLYHYYPLNPSKGGKSGYVLIIDIRDYSSFLRMSRTDKDSHLIQLSLQRLNYKTSVETDLTAQSFAKTLEWHLAKCEEEHMANFILFVLAFGDENDLVCGVDGQAVSLSFMRRKVQDCVYLQGRPKLFFFLSSRGTRPELKVNTTVSADASSLSMHKKDKKQTFHESTSSGDTKISEVSKTDHLPGSSLDKCQSVPKSGDCFVCYACQRHCTVFGLRDKGSWFANVLCGLLLQHASKMHLAELMTEVSFYVSSMKLSSGSNELSENQTFGQMPEILSTLRKRFYFVHPSI